MGLNPVARLGRQQTDGAVAEDRIRPEIRATRRSGGATGACARLRATRHRKEDPRARSHLRMDRSLAEGYEGYEVLEVLVRYAEPQDTSTVLIEAMGRSSHAASRHTRISARHLCGRRMVLAQPND